MVDQRFSVSIHILTSLAFGKCQDGLLMTSDEIAKSVKTNPAVVRRLVARLVDAKILKAYKGKSGGIELAKCPDQISLSEVYAAASGKTLIQTPSKSPKHSCPVSCSMEKLMKEVVDGVEETSTRYLSTITIGDLTKKIEKHEASLRA